MILPGFRAILVLKELLFDWGQVTAGDKHVYGVYDFGRLRRKTNARK